MRWFLILWLLASLGAHGAHAQFGFVQLIHNAYDAGPVDVYLDDVRLLDNFDFGAATPFVPVLHGAHTVDIVAGSAADNSTVLWTGNLTVVADLAYVVAAYGAATDLQVAVAKNVRLEAQTNDAEFFIMHAAPETGPVDLRLLDVPTSSAVIGLLANNLDVGAIGPYQSLAAGWHAIEITDPANTVHHAGYFLALHGFEGQTFVLLLSDTTPSGTPIFSLMAVATDGSMEVGQIDGPVANEDAVDLPAALTLQGNHPNPFRSTTEIRFMMPRRAAVQLTVYDLLGREIARPVDGTLPAGSHTVRFEAGALPGGVYVYRLTTEHASQTRRLVLLR